MAEHHIETPVTNEVIEKLKAGDSIFITGYLFTGRDSAHKKLIDLLNEGKELPIDVQGQFIYYVGPTPARPGKPIGSAGPTTSYRMDYKAVYMAAVGGAGALISQSIREAEVIAYPELGPEAIRKVKVENFPCIVINDMYGGDLYAEGKKKYQIED